jgi:hypothetical protein
VNFLEPSQTLTKDDKGVELATPISIPFCISFRLLTLTVFLASQVFHCNEINAIVPSIANIVITTISSTNVNAFFVLFIVKKS